MRIGTRRSLVQAALVFAFFLATAPGWLPSAQAVSPNVVVSEVYGGGDEDDGGDG